jgi:hypothetical protein
MRVSKTVPEGFDLIGDIHGHAKELKQLLEKMGYRRLDGDCYRHAGRKVIFAGDFIDRGCQNREVLELVMAMVAGDAALAVMGNHEYNAICYHTPDGKGGYLRKHSDKNTKQHQAFLDEYSDDPKGLQTVLNWFRELPLFLDLGFLRVVHATWEQGIVDQFAPRLAEGNRLTEELLFESQEKRSAAWQAVETLLKGAEMPLPGEHSFIDKDKFPRREIRVKWWLKEASTYRDLAIVPADVLERLPDLPLESHQFVPYPSQAHPVFFGHYWLRGDPGLQCANVACLDYSVAEEGGALACYRWEGEQILSSENFVTVPRFTS